MAFLLNVWILPTGGVASGRVCPAACAADLFLFADRSPASAAGPYGHLVAVTLEGRVEVGGAQPAAVVPGQQAEGQLHTTLRQYC